MFHILSVPHIFVSCDQSFGLLATDLKSILNTFFLSLFSFILSWTTSDSWRFLQTGLFQKKFKKRLFSKTSNIFGIRGIQHIFSWFSFLIKMCIILNKMHSWCSLFFWFFYYFDNKTSKLSNIWFLEISTKRAVSEGVFLKLHSETALFCSSFFTSASEIQHIFNFFYFLFYVYKSYN